MGIHFDGANENYEYENYQSRMDSEPFSVSYWVRSNDTANAGHMALGTATTGSAGNQRMRLFTQTVGFRCVVDYDTTDGTWQVDNAEAVIHDGAWHNIVIAHDRSANAAPAIYFDGVSQTINEITGSSGSLATGSDSVTIGSTINSGNDYEGDMAEVAFWDAVLNANEAKALADGISPQKIRTPNLITHLTFIDATTGVVDLVTGTTPTVTNGTPNTVTHVPVQMATPFRQAGWTTPVLSGAGAFTLTVDPASYSLTAQDLSPEFGRELVPDSASYALTAQDLDPLFGREVVPENAAYILTAQDVDLEFGREVVPESAAYTMTAQDVSLEFGREIVPDAEAYVITANDLDPLFGREIVPDPAAYVLTAQDVTLTHDTPGNFVIAADPAAYTISAATASLLLGRVVAAEGDSYTLTASAASLLLGRAIAASAAEYTLTFATVTLDTTAVAAVEAEHHPPIHYTVSNGRWVERRGGGRVPGGWPKT